jgi:hypothetical protein
MDTFAIMIGIVLGLFEIPACFVVLARSVLIAERVENMPDGCATALGSVLLGPMAFVNAIFYVLLKVTGPFWTKFALIFGVPSLLFVLLITTMMRARTPAGVLFSTFARACALAFVAWTLFGLFRPGTVAIHLDNWVAAVLSLIGLPAAFLTAGLAINTYKSTATPPSGPIRPKQRYLPPEDEDDTQGR